MRASLAAVILAGSLAVAVTAPAAATDTYALVIGIDDYQSINKLEGAVNDAKDVADALKKTGAREIITLFDRQVTRDAVMASWKKLLGEAKKGDVLIFHYAGHGGQEPEHVKGSEPTGADSVLLLAGFDVEGQGTYERIVDDELGGMFLQASKAGLNVLVVADACHSGTMTRDFKSSPVPRRRVRATTYPPISYTDDRLPPIDPALAQIPDDIPNVTYFGAVQDNELAPEVDIDGKARGALSWALAEGLRGGADANHDGVITKEELQVFITENVRMKLEGQQHPSVVPLGHRALALKVSGGSDPGPAPAEAKTKATTQGPAATPGPSGPASLPGLRLAVINAPAGGIAALIQPLKGATAVAVEDRPGPALTWDVGRGQLFNALGDLVADFGSAPGDGAAGTRAFKRDITAGSALQRDGAADLPKVQAVVDKWRLVDRIERLAESRSLHMALSPDDKRHGDGDKVAFVIDGHTSTFLTLFNLASDGTVNFLYPLDTAEAKDPLEIPLGRPYSVPLVVEAPFGADHLVAIASSTALTGLHRDLRALDGKPASAAFEATLSGALEGQNYKIGIHGSYTGPRS